MAVPSGQLLDFAMSGTEDVGEWVSVKTGLRERGAAAVEFALVVPILIALVLAIAAFGRGYQIQSSLSMAAREGARVAAIEMDAEKGRTRAAEAADDFGLDDVTTAADGSDNCDAPNERVRIQVSTDYDFLGFSGFLGVPSGVTMTGRAEMRCGG